jgi:hypothetical protein
LALSASAGAAARVAAAIARAAAEFRKLRALGMVALLKVNFQELCRRQSSKGSPFGYRIRRNPTFGRLLPAFREWMNF